MNFENYNISRGFGAMGNGWNSEFNLKKDERLNYRLSVFDLEQLINLFFENNISFIEMYLEASSTRCSTDIFIHYSFKHKNNFHFQKKML